MLVSKQMHLHWEVLKWLAIISLAIAVAIALTTQLATGADRSPTSPPGLLPPEMAQAATPIGQDTAQLLMPITEDEAMNVWQVLETQRQSNWELAIVMWNGTNLVGENQVWKHIAIAHAYFHLAQFDEAEAELELAQQFQPENAVLRYFTGLLRLQQSTTAEEWYEVTSPKNEMLVSHMPVVPNTPSMYKLAAINELQAAVTHASDIHVDAPLVQPQSPTEAALLPSVGDLLFALDAEQFYGKAHKTLSSLYMENGRLTAAEEHLDAAHTVGITIVSGYTELGDRFSRQGSHSDAMRAYAKAIARQPGNVAPTRKTLQTLRDAIREIW